MDYLDMLDKLKYLSGQHIKKKNIFILELFCYAHTCVYVYISPENTTVEHDSNTTNRI